MIKSGKIQPGMGMPPGGRRELQPPFPPGPARFYPDFGEYSHCSKVLLAGSLTTSDQLTNTSLPLDRASHSRRSWPPALPRIRSRPRRSWSPFLEPPELLRLPATPALARLQRCRADAAAQEEVGSPAGARAAKLSPGTAIQPK